MKENLKVILLPERIQLGSFWKKNVRKIGFDKNNPKHIKMFEKFYNIKIVSIKDDGTAIYSQN